VYGHLWERCSLWPGRWHMEHLAAVALLASKLGLWRKPSWSTSKAVRRWCEGFIAALLCSPSKTVPHPAWLHCIWISASCHSVFLHMLGLAGNKLATGRNNGHELFICRSCTTKRLCHFEARLIFSGKCIFQETGSSVTGKSCVF